MKAERKIVQSDDYLNGFNDVYKAFSVKPSKDSVITGVLGIGKILSYIFIVPPVIAWLSKNENRKILHLQTSIDDAINNSSTDAQIQKIFNDLVPSKNKNLIHHLEDYLITKLDNYEKTDDRNMLNEHYKKVIPKLDQESQTHLLDYLLKKKKLNKFLQTADPEVINLLKSNEDCRLKLEKYQIEVFFKDRVKLLSTDQNVQNEFVDLFQSIHFDSQEYLFQNSCRSGVLEVVMRLIPRDAKELNFFPLSENHRKSDENAPFVLEFVKSLKEFNNLERIELSLRGLGIPNTNRIIAHYRDGFPRPNIDFFSDDTESVLISFFGRVETLNNQSGAIMTSMDRLIQLFETNPNLKAKISFTNGVISIDGNNNISYSLSNSNWDLNEIIRKISSMSSSATS